MKQIIECVANFSEGRNAETLSEIAQAIESVDEVKLLHMDQGVAAYRTVMTFAGEARQVVEAAYRAIKVAAKLIDMRVQTGEHPRIGATDVCPLVPLANITLEEVVVLAHELSERVATELGIAVYNYEFAASCAERRNLANCRKGEYEGIQQKLKLENWQPDYGSSEVTEQLLKSGITLISARNFLLAYNVNLATKEVAVAEKIAGEVRESGVAVRDAVTGDILRDAAGKALRKKGLLKDVKAIGWFIKEYDQTQISMNLTNIYSTTIATTYDAVKKVAQSYGVEVTGSELIGLMPLPALLEAGQYYWVKTVQKGTPTEKDLVELAVQELGLNDIIPFDPKKKVIEYVMSGRESVV